MPTIAVILSLLLPSMALAAAPTTQPATQPLTPGDHKRVLGVDDLTRSYLVHVPPGYDARKPTPVVLVLHGAFGNGARVASFSGMTSKADHEGFVVVYPNGTGAGEVALFWNSGGNRSSVVDDVKFVDKLLDDLATVVNVDPKRIFATGMSNGGFMCYRLAAELSERIAAIAPVAGTLAIENPKPKRPVPLIHFHGTADTLVPFDGPNERTPRGMKFLSVDATMKTWAKLNGCPEQPKATTMPDSARDGMTVTKKVYGPGRNDSEIVLYIIEGGGHTWPGRQPPVGFIGKSTMSVSANDLMWDFFVKHPMK